MAKEYIEREAAYKFMLDIPNPNGAGEIEVVSVDDLDSIPAADVVARDCYDRLLAENDELRKERPVRHGRWIKARGSYRFDGRLVAGWARQEYLPCERANELASKGDEDGRTISAPGAAKGGNMKQAVLLSIRPKWCELIASGKKTIEVRKTRPKLETPFKCYIYETKGFERVGGGGRSAVIGEFVCDKIVAVLAHPTIFAGHPMFFEKACKDACLSYDEIENYAGDNDVYGWHIADLKIYDNPRELSEFCTGRSHFIIGANGRLCYSGMTRPPQSWCYVEEKT